MRAAAADADFVRVASPPRLFPVADDSGATALGEALAHNTHLRELQASGHSLSPAALAAVGRGVRSSRVSCLRIGCESTGCEGVAAMCDALAGSPHLEELDLELKGLRTAGALASALPALPRLARLRVGRNPLEADAIATLFAAVGTATALRELHAEQANAGHASALAALAKSLAPPPGGADGGAESALRVLVLSGNALDADSFAPIADALSRRGRPLERLALRDCGLSDEQGAHAALAVRAAADVDLSGNALGEAFVAGLEAAPLDPASGAGPRKVALASTGLGGALAVRAARALADAASLPASVDLSHNQVGAEAAHVVHALRGCSDLALFDTGAGRCDVARLAAALTEPDCHLRSLDLGACGLSDAGCAILFEALCADGTPPSLRTLELFGNDVSDALASRVQEATAAGTLQCDVAWRRRKQQDLPQRG